MTFNFLKKNRSVKYSWVLSYIFILMVAVITETFVYYFNTNVVEDEINRSNELVIGKIRNDVDGMLTEVERFSVAVATSQNVLSLLTMETPVDDESRYRLYQVGHDLYNYRIFNGYVRNYYINLNNLGIVLSPGVINDQTSFFEQNIKVKDYKIDQWLEAMKNIKTANYTLMPVHDDITGDKEVVAYTRSIPISSMGSPSASLVILLDFNELVGKIENQNDSFNERKLYIIDKDNNIITGQSGAGSDFKLNYDKMKGDQGTLNQTYNGKKAVISYTTSHINGWKYVTVTPEKVFWERLRFTRNIMLGGLGFCILFGAFISYFFMRRNYNPLKEVITSFQNKLHMKADWNHDEYGFIQKALSDTLEQKATISQKLEQQNNALKSNFISALLKGRYMTAPVHEMMTSFNIAFKNNSFIVMAIYIENIDEDFWTEYNEEPSFKYALCRFVITNVVEELANRSFCGHMAEVDDMLACLINLDSSSVNYKTILIDIITEAKEFIEKNFKINLSFSIGGLHESIEGIPEAFTESVNAMEYIHVMGLDKTIFFDEITNESGSSYYYPVEKEYRLINYIKSANYTAAENIIEEIFSKNFENSSPSLEITRCLMFDLMSTLLKTGSEIKKVEERGFIEKLDYDGDLIKCMNYVELKNKILKIIKNICNNISKNIQQTDNNVVDMIGKIVTDNFQDANLGIATIADQIGKHPYYASRIFKEQTGEGILEFINRIRITKAKELLLENLWNQEEIAEKVGYTNVRTFQRAFKKQEGTSPGKLKG